MCDYLKSDEGLEEVNINPSFWVYGGIDGDDHEECDTVEFVEQDLHWFIKHPNAQNEEPSTFAYCPFGSVGEPHENKIIQAVEAQIIDGRWFWLIHLS